MRDLSEALRDPRPEEAAFAARDAGEALAIGSLAADLAGGLGALGGYLLNEARRTAGRERDLASLRAALGPGRGHP